MLTLVFHVVIYLGWQFKTYSMRFFLILTILLGLLYPVQAQTIKTYVGDSLSGNAGDGGPATMAELGFPIGLNVLKDGRLLVCMPSVLRSVTINTNIITTIAGSDTATSGGGGGDGGPATRAFILGLFSACADTEGNLYIADNWYSEIRKVDISTGIIDTFAGCRIAGFSGDGGNAKNAKFYGVFTVLIDTVRNMMYISDEFNFRVRSVDMTTNIINTFAGTGTDAFSGDGGPASAADFSRVLGLALDRSGNLYIGDWDNGRIRKVDVATGIVTTVAGNGTTGFSGDGGPATAAQINKTTAICFDSCGNMYFSDENNQRVRRIDANTGIITTIAGNGTAGFSGDGGPATAAEFNHPTGVAMDKYGSLNVADYYNNRVRRIADVACNYSRTAASEVSAANVSIFPNPAINELNIDHVAAGCSYRLTNLLGVVVQQGALSEGENGISIAHCAPGLYLLEITDANGVKEIRKIVKD